MQAYIPAEYDDIDEEPEIRLKSGIDLNDLRAGKDTTFEIEDEDAETKSEFIISLVIVDLYK